MQEIRWYRDFIVVLVHSRTAFFIRKGMVDVKKGFKLVSAFLLSFMMLMSNIMPAFAEETDTSTTTDLLDKIQERGELIVGTSPDFPPNEFIDSTKTGQAQYVGSDIELAKYIAKKMGVKLTIKASSFDTVLANLQTEEIDLAITGLALHLLVLNRWKCQLDTILMKIRADRLLLSQRKMQINIKN